MLCDKSHLYGQNRGMENSRLELPHDGYVDKMVIDGSKKGSEGEKNVETWYSSSNASLSATLLYSMD